MVTTINIWDIYSIFQVDYIDKDIFSICDSTAIHLISAYYEVGNANKVSLILEILTKCPEYEILHQNHKIFAESH